MQNSSEFQYVAIDQLFESKTNPRKTFDQKKLEELAESIRSGGLIQPIVVRPKDKRLRDRCRCEALPSGTACRRVLTPRPHQGTHGCPGA